MRITHLGSAVMAAVITIAGITACSPVNDATGTPTTQKDSPMSKANSCTGLGNYQLSLSVNGSSPMLPESALGSAYTPRVRLSGTKAHEDPATVDLSVVADQPKPATPEDFRSLVLGDVVTFRGYTLKVTSICDGNAGFDLVSQEE